MNTLIYDHFFVARQPIFYDTGQIWGYELLFRSGPDYKVASITDGDLATFSVAMPCHHLVGLEAVEELAEDGGVIGPSG